MLALDIGGHTEFLIFVSNRDKSRVVLVPELPVATSELRVGAVDVMIVERFAVVDHGGDPGVFVLEEGNLKWERE